MNKNPYQQFDKIIAELNDISRQKFFLYAYSIIRKLDLSLQLEHAEYKAMKAMDEVEQIKQQIKKEKESVSTDTSDIR